jgi:putative lipoprotein
MRLLTGTIALPPNAPSRPAALTLIEVRDVSVADAPSVVVAQKRLSSMIVEPNELVTFQIEVPEVADNQSLALRIHISLDGSTQPKPGDLLSVSRYTVPSRGQPEPMSVQVVVI